MPQYKESVERYLIAFVVIATILICGFGFLLAKTYLADTPVYKRNFVTWVCHDELKPYHIVTSKHDEINFIIDNQTSEFISVQQYRVITSGCDVLLMSDPVRVDEEDRRYYQTLADTTPNVK